jgi:hypothetical protein
MARSIATNTAVELDELLDFVRPRHRLLLATSRRNGRRPQISPVSGGVDAQGRIVISTYPRGRSLDYWNPIRKPAARLVSSVVSFGHVQPRPRRAEWPSVTRGRMSPDTPIHRPQNSKRVR